MKKIHLKGASGNNLKSVDVEIPWYSLSVVTGLSGSGKSSLALDTIHSESRRRYLESMSTYARQFLEKIDKPEFVSLDGLPPSICIESRNNIKNSRSTVGTMTEIYDYLRVVFSKIGDKHPGSPLADRFSSGGSNAQKKVTEVAKKHGLLKKDGGQNMSKVKL